ncbi:MAG: CBS domain-containing protein [Pirellulaceae bacterium]
MPYPSESPFCRSLGIRRGVAAMESAVVLCLIILGALVALNALSSSTKRGFEGVAMELGETRVAPATRQEFVAEKQELEEQYEEMSNKADIAMAICVFCIVIIGGLYLRLWRKRRVDLKQKEVEVEQIQQRSVALRQVLMKRNSIFNRIDENWESILSGSAIVGTYMSTNVVAVDPLMPKTEALIRMKEQGFRRFMVKRKDGTLAGVVSKKDIMSKPGDRVCDVMTGQPRMATPDTELHTALSVLLENRISCLPVVKDKMLVGLLSVSDLLMVLQCLLRDLSTRDIDPAYIEAQAHHDRCELVQEIEPQQKRMQTHLG